jgi:probable phosphoglycerate mutase
MFYLVRHGETAWSLTGQHTGFTDLSLTENGRDQAKALQLILEKLSFSEVWCSPLKRARETCQLAGFSEHAEIMPELTEWNYGSYEGLTRAEIIPKEPGWNIFENGAPSGESPADIQARATKVIARLHQATGPVLIFSSAHILRSIASCYVTQTPDFGKYLLLNPTSISILDYEHQIPVIKLWNWVKK